MSIQRGGNGRPGLLCYRRLLKETIMTTISWLDAAEKLNFLIIFFHKAKTNDIDMKIVGHSGAFNLHPRYRTTDSQGMLRVEETVFPVEEHTK